MQLLFLITIRAHAGITVRYMTGLRLAWACEQRKYTMFNLSGTAPAPAQPWTDEEKKKKGWRVLLFGVLSNFSIGILYTWSNLKDILEYRSVNYLNGVARAVDAADRLYKEWDISQLSLPYAVGGFISAAIVLIAGPLQDKIGPTKVIWAGIWMVGGGAVLCSFFTHSPLWFTVMFALTIGNGIGFVYACPRAAAMKWFHPSKKGLVNGLVVAGFGLGALWIAPLEIYMLKTLNMSLENTLRILGVLIFIIGTIAAFNVYNPPAGYHYPELPASNVPLKENQKKSASVGMGTVAKSPQAWMLFFVYAFYCSAGAMVISNASDIMRVQSGGTEGPYGATVAALLGIMVLVASLSNATGRSLGGMLSDKIGRKPVYYLIHTVQAINMFMFHTYTTPTMILIGTIITCVAYGTVMSTTPSIVADYWGLKAYGANYAVVYTGWGLSLMIGPNISSWSKKQVMSQIAQGVPGVDISQSYHLAYYSAVGLIAISAVLVFLVKKPKFKQSEIIDDYVLSPEETRA